MYIRQRHREREREEESKEGRASAHVCAGYTDWKVKQKTFYLYLLHASE